MPLGDLRAELTLAARWALAELGEEQLVMKVVQKDGDRFPELVREVHARIVEPGHAQAARMFERMFSELASRGVTRARLPQWRSARWSTTARADHVRRTSRGSRRRGVHRGLGGHLGDIRPWCSMPRAGKEK